MLRGLNGKKKSSCPRKCQTITFSASPKLKSPRAGQEKPGKIPYPNLLKVSPTIKTFPVSLKKYFFISFLSCMCNNEAVTSQSGMTVGFQFRD